MDGSILECCRVSKQVQRFLERDRGMGSGSADGNMGGTERVGRNKKQNVKRV